ncbi:MAG: hypothetical protein JSS75_08580 [Bacteroidetes bacterium]|nr:hypothetical protein [Bacteroidota bacterium]
MYRFLAIVFCASLLFSGCIDIFIDVVHNPDNTFTLRKMVSIDDSLFVMLQDFANSMGDSTAKKPTKRMMLDSMEHEFAWEREVLLATKGVTWYASRDSEASGRTFILSEIGVKDAASLSTASVALMQTLDSKKPEERDPDNSRPTVKCAVTAEGTSITFSFEKGKKKQTQEDLGMATQLFKDHGLFIRVFSPTLAVSKNKQIFPIDGGQEWRIPLVKMMDEKYLAKTKATFLLKGVR